MTRTPKNFEEFFADARSVYDSLLERLESARITKEKEGDW